LLGLFLERETFSNKEHKRTQLILDIAIIATVLGAGYYWVQSWNMHLVYTQVAIWYMLTSIYFVLVLVFLVLLKIYSLNKYKFFPTTTSTSAETIK